MKITITTIEASADDLASNRRVADAIMDALSRICDAVARPMTEAEETWEEEEGGDSE